VTAIKKIIILLLALERYTNVSSKMFFFLNLGKIGILPFL
jgi:hypothetical protein